MFDSKNTNHVWHQFIIRNNVRDKLQNYLTAKGIQTLIHYPVPPHKQLAYSEWNKLSYEITEKIHNEVLSLPISPIMLQHEAALIINYLNKFENL